MLIKHVRLHVCVCVCVCVCVASTSSYTVFLKWVAAGKTFHVLCKWCSMLRAEVVINYEMLCTQQVMTTSWLTHSMLNCASFALLFWHYPLSSTISYYRLHRHSSCHTKFVWTQIPKYLIGIVVFKPGNSTLFTLGPVQTRSIYYCTLSIVYQHLVGSSYCWLEFNQACDKAQCKYCVCLHY